MLKKARRYRFSWLFAALVILIASYPFFGDTTTGAAMGALTSLLVLGTGVHATRARSKTRLVCGALALVAFGSSVTALLTHTRGTVWSEGSFTAYYIFTTVAVFIEVLRPRRFDGDAILGIVSVYMLIGVAFGSLYDLLETIQPGSFLVNVAVSTHDHIGFRQLIFFSFMTLTSVGYGDLTPVTDLAQSLAILEGIVGVLYVAVLVGGVVGAYQPRRDREQSRPISRKSGGNSGPEDT